MRYKKLRKFSGPEVNSTGPQQSLSVEYWYIPRPGQ